MKEQQQIQIEVQPLRLRPLSINAVDAILKGLRSLTIAEGAAVYAEIAQQRMAHVQAAVMLARDIKLGSSSSSADPAAVISTDGGVS